MSIMEVVVAFSVMITLIIFVFNLIPSSVLAIRRGLIKVEANGLAHNLLDIYRNDDWSHLVVNTDKFLPARASDWGVSYTPRVTIKQVTDLDPARVLEVKVTINWEFRSLPQSVSTGAHIWHAQY